MGQWFQENKETAIKGPRSNMDFDVRRVWECPLCYRRERTAGSVVNRTCHCLANQDPPRQTWMTLIDEPKKRPGRPARLPPLPETGERDA